MGFVLITPRSDGFRQVQQIYNSLGAEMANILPVAPSFTGCDTTSSFFGIDKKTVHRIRKQNTTKYQTLTNLAVLMLIHVLKQVGCL